MGIEGDFIEAQQELARMPSQPHLIFAMAVCLVLVFGQGVRAELDDKVESSSLLPTKTIKGHTLDPVDSGHPRRSCTIRTAQKLATQTLATQQGQRRKLPPQCKRRVPPRRTHRPKVTLRRERMVAVHRELRAQLQQWMVLESRTSGRPAVLRNLVNGSHSSLIRMFTTGWARLRRVAPIFQALSHLRQHLTEQRTYPYIRRSRSSQSTRNFH